MNMFQYECCGANNYTDYKGSNFYNTTGELVSVSVNVSTSTCKSPSRRCRPIGLLHMIEWERGDHIPGLIILLGSKMINYTQSG